MSRGEGNQRGPFLEAHLQAVLLGRGLLSEAHTRPGPFPGSGHRGYSAPCQHRARVKQTLSSLSSGSPRSITEHLAGHRRVAGSTGSGEGLGLDQSTNMGAKRGALFLLQPGALTHPTAWVLGASVLRGREATVPTGCEGGRGHRADPQGLGVQAVGSHTLQKHMCMEVRLSGSPRSWSQTRRMR